MEGVWRVDGGCLEGVWRVDGGWMEMRAPLIPLRLLSSPPPLLSSPSSTQDPFGHVNPLYSPPAVDPLALASPQKVSFYSPEGSKLTFMAMPIM